MSRRPSWDVCCFWQAAPTSMRTCADFFREAGSVLDETCGALSQEALLVAECRFRFWHCCEAAYTGAPCGAGAASVKCSLDWTFGCTGLVRRRHIRSEAALADALLVFEVVLTPESLRYLFLECLVDFKTPSAFPCRSACPALSDCSEAEVCRYFGEHEFWMFSDLDQCKCEAAPPGKCVIFSACWASSVEQCVLPPFNKEHASRQWLYTRILA